MSIGHWKEHRYDFGRERYPRPKSFKSKEKAEEYAKKMKLTKYKVVQLKHGLSKKFKIVKE
tara:strand:+ start:11965 stop:12147 length:183 start_codon:yes stop_codon:yes gene_type:complete